MTYVIGVGGLGISVVQRLFEQGEEISGAMSFNNEDLTNLQQQLLETSTGKWKHIQLTDASTTISHLLAESKRNALSNEQVQVTLKQQASWRPSEDALNISVNSGSGGMRSIGRLVVISAENAIKESIQSLPDDDIHLVGASTGGTGSVLLVEIVKYLEDLRPDLSLSITIINSIIGENKLVQSANSVATAFELQSHISSSWRLGRSQPRSGLRLMNVVKEPYPLLIDTAVEFVKKTIDTTLLKTWSQAFKSSVSNELNPSIRKKYSPSSEYVQGLFRRTLGVYAGNIHSVIGETFPPEELQKFYEILDRQARHFLQEWAIIHFDVYGTTLSALTEVSLGRIDLLHDFNSRRFMDLARTLIDDDNEKLWQLWSMCRTRVLTEFVDQKVLDTCIKGWVSALCLDRISISENSIQIEATDGITHKFFTLRPFDSGGLDALPCVIEAATLSLTADPKLEQFGNAAVRTLMEYALVELSTSTGVIEINEFMPQSEFQRETLELVGLGAPINSNSKSSSESSEDQTGTILNLQHRKALALYQSAYNGDESVNSDGSIDPPETFFRDIIDQYIKEVEERLSFGESADLSPSTNQMFDFLAKSRNSSNSRKRLRIKIPRNWWRRIQQSSKPYAFVRYGIAIVLGVFSALFFFVALSGDEKQQHAWAQSSTVVSGLMGGFAVCLGAVALISSIQNSSVRMQRTDRLYESCLGVQEAITFFELGLKSASVVFVDEKNPKKIWENPSLYFSVIILGSKLRSSMDSGLFRLLSYVDDLDGISPRSIKKSSALQAFTLLDHLARISPEIISERKEAGQDLITTPEQLMEIADDLRQVVSQISYRTVAKSLEFAPSLKNLT